MESRLLETWARGFPEKRTVEGVFGPYDQWLLPLGEHLLLLHPALKEWLVLDRLHDTWEHTGLGPGEVVFVAQEKRLGFRRRKHTLEAGGQLPEQTTSVTAQGDQETARFCRSCGARVRPGHKYCTQCGAPLS
jgi:hypothetical protein